jgi:ribose transport system permease protein
VDRRHLGGLRAGRGAGRRGQLVLTRTVFGRQVVGIGTNEEAMRLAGIDPRPIRIIVFASPAFLAGLAG